VDVALRPRKKKRRRRPRAAADGEPVEDPGHPPAATLVAVAEHVEAPEVVAERMKSKRRARRP